MGLLVQVVHNNLGDCTNGGISSNLKELLLVNVSGSTSPNARYIPAMLVEGNMPGLVKIVPVDLVEGAYVATKRWSMFGGNFAYTSDSRFHDAVRKITGTSYGAVPIHDRFE